MSTPVATTPKDTHRNWMIPLACAWLMLFAICFYQFDLPNSSPRVNRLRIWSELPVLLINNIDPPLPDARDLEGRRLWRLAGWSFVPQRFPLYGIAFWILLGAVSWGRLGLRWLRIFSVSHSQSVPLQHGPPNSLPNKLDEAGRFFFASVLGISWLSLLTLGLGLAGLLSFVVAALVVSAPIPLEAWSLWIPRGGTACSSRTGLFKSTNIWVWLITIPFLMCYIGGAFLPEVDFDVKEYHFGGPKEWFLAGKISFLPHNVYTSFPFLTEMVTLLAMTLHGDWYWGAIAGKGVLMFFGPLTCVALYSAGKRWFSREAGVWAALIHLTTPWIYRISIIAYAEGGLTCYLMASLFAVGMFLEHQHQQFVEKGANPGAAGGNWKWALVAGLLAGSSMACKYPGVVSVVIPVFAAFGVASVAKRRVSSHSRLDHTQTISTNPTVISAEHSGGTEYGLFKVWGCLTLGVLIACGPWLAKNYWQTGNPVYPLLYSVFGGVDWSPELNAKWKRAHAPENHLASDFVVKVIDVSIKSDWLSPLLFGLAPLAMMAGRQRRAIQWLWLYVFFLFGTWWVLTHRIDRFWVPLIPVVSLLSGIGITWSDQFFWRKYAGSLAGLAMLYNLAFITTSLCGYNSYRLDLATAARQTMNQTAPEIAILNERLPPGSKVLCVGEAEMFDARFGYIYNTVFDTSLFEMWCGVDTPEVPSADRRFRPADEIRTIFREFGITHVFVNWQEILRYRLTYGYTDFVTPSRFLHLRRIGILDEPWQIPGGQLRENLRVDELKQISTWAPELMQDELGRSVFKTFEVFPVAE